MNERYEMETIQELQKKFDGLISSIEPCDFDDKEFMDHKYMLASLHAHTERVKLESLMKAKPAKLVHGKNMICINQSKIF